MKEDIQNDSTIVMFRGTPCITYKSKYVTVLNCEILCLVYDFTP